MIPDKYTKISYIFLYTNNKQLNNKIKMFFTVALMKMKHIGLQIIFTKMHVKSVSWNL